MMKTLLALALALAGSTAAFAAETTDVEITANGVAEKVSIVDLQIGETRQLLSEAGTLVTATRTADSLQLDIGGEKTSVPMGEPEALGDAELVDLIGDDDALDGKRIVIVKRQHADGHGDHAAHAGGKRVIVKRRMVEDDNAAK